MPKATPVRREVSNTNYIMSLYCNCFEFIFKGYTSRLCDQLSSAHPHQQHTPRRDARQCYIHLGHSGGSAVAPGGLICAELALHLTTQQL